VPDLRFNIIGDSRSLKRALNGAAKDVKGFKSKLGGIGSIAAGVFGGGAALAGLSSLTHQLGSVVTEAREAAKVGRMTDAVIKSTGGAANVTASQVSRLAEAISNKTGIDDEQIQSAENLLLTFTNVRNEVGKGNDIFNQASQAAIDMSVALGTDSKSAAIQLGKALNDPVKGITALSRAGVSFTKEQKDQIKVLVASGKTLEAQKMILAELGKEFGGAAAAASDPMQRLDTTVNNLKERIGTALLPYIEKAATWLGEKLPQAIDKLSGWLSELRDGFVGAKNKTDDARTALEKAGAIIYDVTQKIKEFWHWLAEKLNDSLAGGKKLVEDLADAFDVNTPTIIAALLGIAAALGVVAVAWNLGPGAIVTGLLLLGAGFLALYNNVSWFRDAVNGQFQLIGGAFQRLVWVWDTGFAAAKVLIGAVVDAFRALWRSGQDAFDRLKSFGGGLYDALAGPFDAIKEAAKSAFNFIADAWNNTVGKIKFTIPDWVPLLGGKTFDVPDIPKLAKGGIVTRPTIAMIGEAGPEAVIPLSRAGRPANIGAGTAGGTINVHIETKVDALSGRVLLRAIQDDQRRNGPWAIKISPTAA